MAKAVLKSCNDSSGRTQIINSSLPDLTVFSFCLAGTSWPKASLPAGPRWLYFCRHPPCCTLPEKKNTFSFPVFSFGVRSAPPTVVQQKWNLCSRPEKTRLVTWRHLQETTLCEIQTEVQEGIFSFLWRGNFEWTVHLLWHAGGRFFNCFSGVCVCEWTGRRSDWGRLCIFYLFDQSSGATLRLTHQTALLPFWGGIFCFFCFLFPGFSTASWLLNVACK